MQGSNLWVGLTAPNYVPPRLNFGGGFGRRFPTNAPGAGPLTNLPPGAFLRGGFPAEVDWQRDAKFYQFWAQAGAQGRFTIPNVRPGRYTLRAIADGVIGELAVTNITIGADQSKSLGELTWSPRRYGRTLWQIGVPDRTAREFRHGDHYWQWGLYFQYPKEFPNDVNYVIGKSDWRKDWNYVQPPRILTQNIPLSRPSATLSPASSGGEGGERGRSPVQRLDTQPVLASLTSNLPVTGEDEDAANAAADFVRRSGREVESTTWSVTFALNQQPRGQATLRLAFCGTHAGCNVEAFVNDQSIGETGTLPSTSAMQRDGIRAFWIEKPLTFDASRMKAGTNVIKLKSHADSWSQGVMYDVVRLELNEAPGH
jgi:rhamnogalacturonan endolyase